MTFDAVLSILLPAIVAASGAALAFQILDRLVFSSNDSDHRHSNQ
jgi:hypothetical protein